MPELPVQSSLLERHFDLLTVLDYMRLLGWRLIIGDGAPGRAFKIVILTAFERPQEAKQADQTEAQRQRHQNDHHFHDDPPFATRRARSALSITRMEEPDIAAAAISGVTTPLIAIGTARIL